MDSSPESYENLFEKMQAFNKERKFLGQSESGGENIGFRKKPTINVLAKHFERGLNYKESLINFTAPTDNLIESIVKKWNGECSFYSRHPILINKLPSPDIDFERRLSIDGKKKLIREIKTKVRIDEVGVVSDLDIVEKFRKMRRNSAENVEKLDAQIRRMLDKELLQREKIIKKHENALIEAQMYEEENIERFKVEKYKEDVEISKRSIKNQNLLTQIQSKSTKDKNQGHSEETKENVRSENHATEKITANDARTHKQLTQNSVHAKIARRIKHSSITHIDSLHRNLQHETNHLANVYKLECKLRDKLISKICLPS